MTTETKKLFIMVTTGPENPELATIPFVLATAAQAGDIEVTMGFQGDGSMLAVQCMLNHVSANGFPKLSVYDKDFSCSRWKNVCLSARRGIKTN